MIDRIAEIVAEFHEDREQTDERVALENLARALARTEAALNPVHAVFSLKQCDQCWAIHESATLTRYCPACGAENHTAVIEAESDSPPGEER